MDPCTAGLCKPSDGKVAAIFAGLPIRVRALAASLRTPSLAAGRDAALRGEGGGGGSQRQGAGAVRRSGGGASCARPPAPVTRLLNRRRATGALQPLPDAFSPGPSCAAPLAATPPCHPAALPSPRLMPVRCDHPAAPLRPPHQQQHNSLLSLLPPSCYLDYCDYCTAPVARVMFSRVEKDAQCRQPGGDAAAAGPADLQKISHEQR